MNIVDTVFEMKDGKISWAWSQRIEKRLLH